jgi:hypothetical protein
MKTFDLKSLLLGVLLTMSVVVVMLVATSNSTPAAWDYQVMHGISLGALENRLNSAAKEGWELVSVSRDKDDNPVAVLKRAKVVQRPPWWQFWKK